MFRTTYINDAQLARVIRVASAIMRDEPDCASKSYIIQRATEALGDYETAKSKVLTLIATKAIVRTVGTRRGFPDVFVQGPRWDWVKAQSEAEHMDYDTLKRMNGH